VPKCYVGGSFDLFHRGHVEVLRQASRFGKIIAAVNADAFHQFYRGRPPIVSEQDRLAVVMACRYVSHAFLVPSHDKQRDIIKAWSPTYIIHGDDWTGDSLLAQLGIDQAFLDEYAIEMRYVPYTKGISSSAIRERLNA